MIKTENYFCKETITTSINKNIFYNMNFNFCKEFSPDTKLSQIREEYFKFINDYFMFLDLSNDLIEKETENSTKIIDTLPRPEVFEPRKKDSFFKQITKVKSKKSDLRLFVFESN